MPAIFEVPGKELNVLNFTSNVRKSANGQRRRWRGEKRPAQSERRYLNRILHLILLPNTLAVHKA